MENDGNIPDPADTIDTAVDKVIFNSRGELIKLEELIAPQYSRCSRCAVTEDCPMYEKNKNKDYCRIEEGLVIEAVKTLAAKGVDINDKLGIYSFITSLMAKVRIDRLGTVMNWKHYYDRDELNVISKWSAMMASIDNRYQKALKELIATRKTEYDVKMSQTVQTVSFLDKLKIVSEEDKKKKELKAHDDD